LRSALFIYCSVAFDAAHAEGGSLPALVRAASASGGAVIARLLAILFALLGAAVAHLRARAAILIRTPCHRPDRFPAHVLAFFAELDAVLHIWHGAASLRAFVASVPAFVARARTFLELLS
jgi:hypothetical protein